ncbi:hypothetical protein [Streptomyces roseus]|uniref:hypothetical protein n=1 Tax=Streptomyces roseus TaxID=66430 RepID=UPI003F4CB336
MDSVRGGGPVPAAVAGVAVTAFSLGTVGLYLRTPGMRQEGSLCPTEQGIALAKDVWLPGTGVSLIAEARANSTGHAPEHVGSNRLPLRTDCMTSAPSALGS